LREGIDNGLIQIWGINRKPRNKMTTEDKGQTQSKRTAKGIALWAMVRRSDDHFTGEAHELKREYGETPNGHAIALSCNRWLAIFTYEH